MTGLDDRYEEGYEDGYESARWELSDDGYEAGFEAGAREFVNDLSVEKLTTVLIQNWKNWHPNQSHGLQRMLASEIKNYLEGLV